MNADESAEGIKRMYRRKLKDHLYSNYCKKYTSAISRKLRIPIKFSASSHSFQDEMDLTALSLTKEFALLSQPPFLQVPSV